MISFQSGEVRSVSERCELAFAAVFDANRRATEAAIFNIRALFRPT